MRALALIIGVILLIVTAGLFVTVMAGALIIWALHGLHKLARPSVSSQPRTRR